MHISHTAFPQFTDRIVTRWNSTKYVYHYQVFWMYKPHSRKYFAQYHISCGVYLKFYDFHICCKMANVLVLYQEWAKILSEISSIFNIFIKNGSYFPIIVVKKHIYWKRLFLGFVENLIVVFWLVGWMICLFLLKRRITLCIFCFSKILIETIVSRTQLHQECDINILVYQ